MRRMIGRIRLCIVFTSMWLWGFGCGQGTTFHDIPSNNVGIASDGMASGGSADAMAGGGAGDEAGAVTGQAATTEGVAANSDSSSATTPSAKQGTLSSSSSDGSGIADNGSAGQGTGSGSGGINPAPIPTPIPTPIPIPSSGVDPLASVLWFWQCNAQPATPPTPASSDDEVIVGAGPYSIAENRVHNTPISLQGQLCQPTQMKRDIVFVIDVSGSMAGSQNHDPRVGNSCGRLAALQAVLANVSQAGLTRFSLVTFSDSVRVTTGGFSTSAASLQSNVLAVSGQSQLADVVCAGSGGTNYNEALTGASRILQGSTDANTSREIYFISDGEPDPAQYDGVAIANGLKSTGVTIATLMLIGNDQGLKKIASIDQTDPTKTRLLHMTVSNAAQLAATLTQLAQNYLISGTIKYHAIGSNQWISFDLMAIQQNFRFQLAPFPSDEQLAPNGLEVAIDYLDKRGTHYGSVGQLLWSK